MGGGTSRDRNQTWEVDAISDHQPKAGQHCSINVMQLSGDNSLLVTGGEDKVVRMWDIVNKEPKCIGRLKGHTDYITQISVIGTHVITGSADKTIRKWSIVDVSCEYIYEGHAQRIQRLICTPQFILSSSTDKTCMLWRMHLPKAGEEPKEQERTDEDPNDDQWIRTFRGHTGTVYALCFVPGDDDDDAPIPSNGTAENGTKENGTTENGAAEDGTTEDGATENGGDEEERAAPPKAAAPLTEDEDGIHPRDILVTGSADGTARSWLLATGQQLKVFKGHRGAVMLMAIDNTGKLLYTAGDDTTVREWNIHQGVCKQVISGNGESVSAMLLQNKLLYTGSADTKARCFITDFGDLTKTYNGHRDTVNILRFNEGILFTGCTDSVARAFDAHTGRLLRCYAGHEAAITCMQVARKRLYTGSDDGILRVWDANVSPDDVSQIAQTMDSSAKSVGDSGGGAHEETPEAPAE